MKRIIKDHIQYFDYLQSLPIPIIIANAKNGLIIFANTKSEELWGYSKKEFIGKPQTFLHSEYWNDKNRETFSSDRKALTSGENVTHSKNAILRSDGEEVSVEIIASMIELEGEDALLGIFNSVQERDDAYALLQAKEHEMNVIFENSAVGLIYLKNGRFVEKVNQHLVDMLGYDNTEEIEGHSVEDFHLSHEHFVWFGEHYFDALVAQEAVHIEYQLRKKNGEPIWVSLSGKAVDTNTPADLLKGVIWIADDISDFKALQENLQNAKKYLQNIIDNVHDPIMIIKEDYSIEVMNQVIQEQIKKLGLATKKEIRCYEIFHNRTTPCDGDEHLCPLKDVIQTKKTTKVIHNHKDTLDNNHFVEIVATPYLDDNGNCIGIIESTRDITEYLELTEHLKEKSNLLEYQAQHDVLTGLANRTLFTDRVKQTIKKDKRSGKKFAIFFIDLDHFKEINDSLGHAIGDEVLIKASNRIASAIREEDTLARLGGDEFCILIDNIESVQDVLYIAQKIITLFHTPLMIEGHRLYPSCSIGISIYPDDGTTNEDLLKYADNAMYKAKSEGRDNFQFYKQEMTELAFERIMLESAMREALEKGQFVLHYQPQYDATCNKIIGTEALIRWEHPTLGMVSPAKFIPVAEETSLIIEIDNWVMQEGIKQFSQWYADGFNPGVLSLNLAIKQLESPNFLTKLHDTLQKYNFNPKWLKLEILERDMMHNPQESVQKLELIQQLGIGLALDDFGTGQSSLTYLKKFPITQLKIDQSFVRDIFNDEVSKVTILAIIALAEALNIEIIAEGVETKEQLDFLLLHNCKNIQGFYFSQAIRKNELEKLLQN